MERSTVSHTLTAVLAVCPLLLARLRSLPDAGRDRRVCGRRPARRGVVGWPPHVRAGGAPARAAQPGAAGAPGRGRRGEPRPRARAPGRVDAGHGRARHGDGARHGRAVAVRDRPAGRRAGPGARAARRTHPAAPRAGARPRRRAGRGLSPSSGSCGDLDRPPSRWRSRPSSPRVSLRAPPSRRPAPCAPRARPRNRSSRPGSRTRGARSPAWSVPGRRRRSNPSRWPRDGRRWRSPIARRLVLARGDLQRLLAAWHVADRRYRLAVDAAVPEPRDRPGSNVDLPRSPCSSCGSSCRWTRRRRPGRAEQARATWPSMTRGRRPRRGARGGLGAAGPRRRGRPTLGGVRAARQAAARAARGGAGALETDPDALGGS